MPSRKDFDYLVKLICIGDSSVGKSSIMNQYVDAEFTESFISTIGVDFKIKTIELDGFLVKIQVWDTSGQERFRTITSSYYRGAHGVLLIFDLTNNKSFENLKMWVNEIDKYAPESIQSIVIGNKSDLIAEREVNYDIASEFALNLNNEYVETSAKSGSNLDSVFVKIVQKIIKRIKEIEEEYNDAPMKKALIIKNPKVEKKCGC
jgi:Ras-related protein Rab-1A